MAALRWPAMRRIDPLWWVVGALLLGGIFAVGLYMYVQHAVDQARGDALARIDREASHTEAGTPQLDAGRGGRVRLRRRRRSRSVRSGARTPGDAVSDGGSGRDLRGRLSRATHPDGGPRRHPAPAAAAEAKMASDRGPRPARRGRRRRSHRVRVSARRAALRRNTNPMGTARVRVKQAAGGLDQLPPLHSSAAAAGAG